MNPFLNIRLGINPQNQGRPTPIPNGHFEYNDRTYSRPRPESTQNVQFFHSNNSIQNSSIPWPPYPSINSSNHVENSVIHFVNNETQHFIAPTVGFVNTQKQHTLPPRFPPPRGIDSMISTPNNFPRPNLPFYASQASLYVRPDTYNSNNIPMTYDGNRDPFNASHRPSVSIPTLNNSFNGDIYSHSHRLNNNRLRNVQSNSHKPPNRIPSRNVVEIHREVSAKSSSKPSFAASPRPQDPKTKIQESSRKRDTAVMLESGEVGEYNGSESDSVIVHEDNIIDVPVQVGQVSSPSGVDIISRTIPTESPLKIRDDNSNVMESSIAPPSPNIFQNLPLSLINPNGDKELRKVDKFRESYFSGEGPNGLACIENRTAFEVTDNDVDVVLLGTSLPDALGKENKEKVLCEEVNAVSLPSSDEPRVSAGRESTSVVDTDWISNSEVSPTLAPTSANSGPSTSTNPAPLEEPSNVISSEPPVHSASETRRPLVRRRMRTLYSSYNFPQTQNRVSAFSQSVLFVFSDRNEVIEIESAHTNSNHGNHTHHLMKGPTTTTTTTTTTPLTGGWPERVRKRVRLNNSTAGANDSLRVSPMTTSSPPVISFWENMPTARPSSPSLLAGSSSSSLRGHERMRTVETRIAGAGVVGEKGKEQDSDGSSDLRKRGEAEEELQALRGKLLQLHREKQLKKSLLAKASTGEQRTASGTGKSILSEEITTNTVLETDSNSSQIIRPLSQAKTGSSMRNGSDSAITRGSSSNASEKVSTARDLLVSVASPQMTRVAQAPLESTQAVPPVKKITITNVSKNTESTGFPASREDDCEGQGMEDGEEVEDELLILRMAAFKSLGNLNTKKSPKSKKRRLDPAHSSKGKRLGAKSPRRERSKSSSLALEAVSPQGSGAPGLDAPVDVLFSSPVSAPVSLREPGPFAFGIVADAMQFDAFLPNVILASIDQPIRPPLPPNMPPNIPQRPQQLPNLDSRAIIDPLTGQPALPQKSFLLGSSENQRIKALGPLPPQSDFFHNIVGDDGWKTTVSAPNPPPPPPPRPPSIPVVLVKNGPAARNTLVLDVPSIEPLPDSFTGSQSSQRHPLIRNPHSSSNNTTPPSKSSRKVGNLVSISNLSGSEPPTSSGSFQRLPPQERPSSMPLLRNNSCQQRGEELEEGEEADENDQNDNSSNIEPSYQTPHGDLRKGGSPLPALEPQPLVVLEDGELEDFSLTEDGEFEEVSATADVLDIVEDGEIVEKGTVKDIQQIVTNVDLEEGEITAEGESSEKLGTRSIATSRAVSQNTEKVGSLDASTAWNDACSTVTGDVSHTNPNLEDGEVQEEEGSEDGEILDEPDSRSGQVSLWTSPSPSQRERDSTSVWKPVRRGKQSLSSNGSYYSVEGTVAHRSATFDADSGNKASINHQLHSNFLKDQSSITNEFLSDHYGRTSAVSAILPQPHNGGFRPPLPPGPRPPALIGTPAVTVSPMQPLLISTSSPAQPGRQITQIQPSGVPVDGFSARAAVQPRNIPLPVVPAEQFTSNHPANPVLSSDLSPSEFPRYNNSDNLESVDMEIDGVGESLLTISSRQQTGTAGTQENSPNLTSSVGYNASQIVPTLVTKASEEKINPAQEIPSVSTDLLNQERLLREAVLLSLRAPATAPIITPSAISSTKNMTAVKQTASSTMNHLTDKGAEFPEISTSLPSEPVETITQEKGASQVSPPHELLNTTGTLSRTVEQLHLDEEDSEENRHRGRKRLRPPSSNPLSTSSLGTIDHSPPIANYQLENTLSDPKDSDHYPFADSTTTRNSSVLATSSADQSQSLAAKPSALNGDEDLLRQAVLKSLGKAKSSAQLSGTNQKSGAFIRRGREKDKSNETADMPQGKSQEATQGSPLKPKAIPNPGVMLTTSHFADHNLNGVNVVAADQPLAAVQLAIERAAVVDVSSVLSETEEVGRNEKELLVSNTPDDTTLVITTSLRNTRKVKSRVGNAVEGTSTETFQSSAAVGESGMSVATVHRADEIKKLRQREAQLKGILESRRIKREIDVYEGVLLEHATKLNQARQLLDGLRQAESEQTKIVCDLREKKSQLLLQASKADLYRVDLMAELASARLQLSMLEKSDEVMKRIPNPSSTSSSKPLQQGSSSVSQATRPTREIPSTVSSTSTTSLPRAVGLHRNSSPKIRNKAPSKPL